MKKFLMLILVLAMTTAANATLSLDYDGVADVNTESAGETVAGAAFDFFMVYTDTLAVPTITLDYTGAGSTLTDVTVAYGTMLEGLLGLGTGDVTAAYSAHISDTDFLLIPNGTMVSSSTTGAGTVYLLDQGGATIETVFIPEPATIALLCLGGLLLRKKK